MTYYIKNGRSVAGTLGLVLAVTLLAVSPTRADDDDHSGVIPPTSRIVYRAYQELAAAWWNWAVIEPAATNPVADSTGEFAHLNQRGLVWFLAGTFGGAVTREVTVPEGKALFFPVINSVFWAPEDGDTEEEVRALANAQTDAVSVLECSIDGKPVKKLFQRHRVETRAFTLEIPEGSILEDFGYPPGDRFPTVSDGYWVLVAPLDRGRHVIHFRGAVGDPDNPDFETEVTYRVRVVKNRDKDD